MKHYNDEINEYYPLDRTGRMLRAAQNEEKVEAALGLAGESGEVVDMIKKNIFYGKSIDRDELKLELGDTLHYLVRLIGLYGWTIEDVATANIEKLDARYGGTTYSDDAAIAQGEKR